MTSTMRSTPCSGRTGGSRRREFQRDALVTGTFMYDEAREDDEGFWARQAPTCSTWSKEWDTICEWELPFAKWFVGGELNVSYNCLDRHVLAGNGDKVAFHLEGEPGDTPDDHLRRAARRDAAVRQRAEVARRRQGRPGQHLPADDPRGGGRDAGLRAHRRRAQRGVRRVQRHVAVRPDQRRRGEGARHRRRRLSPRRGVPAEAGRRRGARRRRRRSPRRRRPARRQRRADGRRPRPLVPRADGRRRPGVPGRADGLRAAAVPAVHVAARPASRRASCTRAAAT